MIAEYMLVIFMEAWSSYSERMSTPQPGARRYVPDECPMMYGFYAIHAERIDTLASIKLAH